MTAVLSSGIWPPQMLPTSLMIHSPPSSRKNDLQNSSLLESLFESVVDANSENLILRVELINGDVYYFDFSQCQCVDYEKECHCFQNAESCMDQEQTRLSLMKVCSNVRRLEKTEHDLVTILYHPHEIDCHLTRFKLLFKKGKFQQDEEQEQDEEKTSKEEDFLVFQMD